VLVAVTSTLTSERIYFLSPNDKEFVGVKVSLKSFSIYVTCSYIPPGSYLTIYEQHLSEIKSVLSHLSERDLLIVLGDFNLPDISWSLSTDSLTRRAKSLKLTIQNSKRVSATNAFGPA